MKHSIFKGSWSGFSTCQLVEQGGREVSSQTMEINILEIDIHLVRIHVNLILKDGVPSEF